MHLTSVLREWRLALRGGWYASWLAILLIPFAAVVPADAADHDELTIGVVQFPVMLNPDIEAVAAKSYVLGFTTRPFTVFDADWKVVCLLCTELPSFENGRAVKTQLPDGKTGVDLTYTIRPDAQWGDGVPVTTDDVHVHLRGRAQPGQCGQQRRTLSPHLWPSTSRTTRPSPCMSTG